MASLKAMLAEIERRGFLPVIDSAPVIGWAVKWGVMHECRIMEPSHTDILALAVHDDVTEAVRMALTRLNEGGY